jgi:hypothetical protein
MVTLPQVAQAEPPDNRLMATNEGAKKDNFTRFMVFSVLIQILVRGFRTDQALEPEMGCTPEAVRNMPGDTPNLAL